MRIPYAQLPGRIGRLYMKDVGRYCRDHGLTWDEFWAKSKVLEASVKRSGAPRRSVADTPPLLSLNEPRLSYYHKFHHLPSGDFVFLYGCCHDSGTYDRRTK